MGADQSVVELLGRWQSGDETAAAQIVAAYGDRLLELARRHMGHQLLARVSPESVVQVALETFLRRVAQRQYLLTETISIWRLLAEITLNKVRRYGEFHRAAKRCVAREVGWDNGDELVQIAAKGPTAEHSLMLLDLVQVALDRLPTSMRELVILFLEGNSHSEIAQMRGISRATSHRALQRFRSIVQKLSNDQGGK